MFDDPKESEAYKTFSLWQSQPFQNFRSPESNDIVENLRRKKQPIVPHMIDHHRIQSLQVHIKSSLRSNSDVKYSRLK